MKTLKRALALILSLAMIFSLMIVGVSAEKGYTTPDSESVESNAKYDTDSNVYLKLKEYDESNGVLTLTVGGQLSDMGKSDAEKSLGWSTIGFTITVDNTKLAMISSKGNVRGDSSSANSTEAKKVGGILYVLLESGEDLGDGEIEATNKTYEVSDLKYFKADGRTAYYVTIYPGAEKVPYGQSYETPTDFVNLTFKVAEKASGGYYSLEELSSFFTKDTIRFVDWSKAEDAAAADVFKNLNAAVQYVPYNTETKGAMRWYGAVNSSEITDNSIVKLMQATVNYPGVDNVTPGSLSGDMVGDSVAYNSAQAVEIPVLAPTLLDTDGDSINGGSYNITYSVSHNGGESFADVTYADGKITVPADFVKAAVAADTPVVITVTAQLDGYEAIKLTDTVAVNVAASEVTKIDGPTSVVRGQSEGQTLKYEYTAIDQYGNPCTTNWLLGEGMGQFAPAENTVGFYENGEFVNAQNVMSKSTVVVGFGTEASDSIKLTYGNENITIAVNDLMAKDGAALPTVESSFTYGQYTSFASVVTAPATVALTDGANGSYTASNPVIKVYDANGTDVTTGKVNAGSYNAYVEYSTDFTGGVEFTCGPMKIEVEKKEISPSFGGITKVYDGTTEYTGDQKPVIDKSYIVTGDEVNIAEYTIEFGSPNAGNEIQINCKITALGGADKDNYTFHGGGNVTWNGTITPKPLTVTATIGAVSKVYDGTTAVEEDDLASISVAVSDGVIGNDEVSAKFTDAAYADKNAGTGKTITVSGITLEGAAAGNYSVASTYAATGGEITAKEITPVLEASNKVWDATTVVEIYTVSFTGLVDEDKLVEDTDYEVSALAFSAADVGSTGVSGKIKLLDTTAASNYTLSTDNLRDEEAKIVDMTLKDQPKLNSGEFVYGTTTYADLITLPDMSGLIVSEGIDAANAVKFDIAAYDENGTEIFEAKDCTVLPTDRVAVAVKKVVVTFCDKDGNAVPSQNITGFTVEPKTLTVSAEAVTKTYDGTDSAVVALELEGVVGTDKVSIASSYAAAFDTKDAGTNKTVTVSGLALDNANYTVAETKEISGCTITPKEITVSYTGEDLTKVYDGTRAYETDVTGFEESGLVGSETVEVSYEKAEFNSADVASAEKVTLSGLKVNSANYKLKSTSLDIDASITPVSITAALNVANKVWDGTDKAFNYGVSFTGLVNGETTTEYTVSDVKFGGTGVGSDAVGTVTLAANSNYTLSGTTVTGEITKNTSAEVTFGTKTAADGTVTMNVKVTVKDQAGNTVTVSDPEYTASPAAPKSGDVITVTVDNDNYSAAAAARLTYIGGIKVVFTSSDADLAALNDNTTVLENAAAAFASALTDASGNDAHITVAVQVFEVEKDDDGVITALKLGVSASRAVDSTGAKALTSLSDELVLKLNVPASVDKAYAKVTGSSTQYIELAEGEDVLTLTIDDTKLTTYEIEFTDEDGTYDDGTIVGPAVLVYTTAKPGGVVYPETKWVAKGGTTYIAIAPNPGNTIDTIKINGVVVNYKDMLVGPNDAGLYHLRLTNLNRDTYVEISFKLKGVDVWSNPFTDVKLTDWFYSSVEFASVNGLFNGTSATTFSPEEPMTRAMLVTVLHRLEGGPVMYSKASFKDVPADKYYTDAVAWASCVGIVTGNTDGTFDPDGLVTREQMAAILWRYAKYKGYDVSVGENTNILSYDDAFSVSEYAIPAMQWACGSGIINGVTPSTLQPKANASRAVVATILMRFCNYYMV